jgi:hypothetical protein
MPLRVLTDTFDGERTACKHRFILVRPDQYVAWTSDDTPESVLDILRKVTGDLGAEALPSLASRLGGRCVRADSGSAVCPINVSIR